MMPCKPQVGVRAGLAKRAPFRGILQGHVAPSAGGSGPAKCQEKGEALPFVAVALAAAFPLLAVSSKDSGPRALLPHGDRHPFGAPARLGKWLYHSHEQHHPGQDMSKG